MKGYYQRPHKTNRRAACGPHAASWTSLTDIIINLSLYCCWTVFLFVRVFCIFLHNVHFLSVQSSSCSSQQYSTRNFLWQRSHCSCLRSFSASNPRAASWPASVCTSVLCRQGLSRFGMWPSVLRSPAFPSVNKSVLSSSGGSVKAVKRETNILVPA
jgi:hypothetical protein